MKRYSKKIAIILTLVMILTSFGFTGAFAVDENGAGETGDQAVQVTEPEEEVAAPDEPEAVDETAVEEEAAEEEATEEAVEASNDPVETVTITWTVGTASTTSEAELGTVPVYPGGTPMLPGYTEENYRFTGWSDGTTTYAPGEALPAASAAAAYTAQFVSLNVTPATPVLLKNKANQAFAGYKTVHVEWEPVTKDVNGYDYDEGVELEYEVRPANPEIIMTMDSETSAHTNGKLDAFTTYTFFVKAKVKGTENASAEASITGCPVKNIKYRLTIKSGTTLKKHAGNGPATYKLKKGQTIDTDRFQTGKYIFEYQGSIFYIKQSRVRKASCSYNTKWDYMDKEAEYYVNDRRAMKGTTSATDFYIFVSTYCQRVYYLQKDDVTGLWKVTDAWNCGTGKAYTPTPTGDFGEKYIHKKVKRRHSIVCWNMFNGTAALHGMKPRTKLSSLGKVVSSGCVRNPDDKARKIYNNAPKKSRVLII